MLPEKINIFTLSPKEDDAAFINSTLRNAGISAQALWSRDPEKCLHQLNKGNLHLIFFRANNFSAQDEVWIERFKGIDKNIPIILLHHELTEQTLASCIQMNAHDLVTLAIPDRLLFITMRELSTYLKTKELLKLRDENESYKAQLKNLQKESDVASLVVFDGIIVNSNPAANELLIGSTDNSLDTQTILDFVVDSDQLILKGALQAAKQGKFADNELILKFRNIDSEETKRLQCDIKEYLHHGEQSLKIQLREVVNTSQETHTSFAIDPLSNVFHRQHFLDISQDRLKEKIENGILAILYIKIDDFKLYQNTYDLITADCIIKHVGEALIETSNKGDVYGRFSGSAFIVQTLKGTLRDVESWAKHFQDYLSETPVNINGDSINVSCSIGIAEYLDGKDNLIKWVTRARDAHTIARKDKKGTIYIDKTITETTQTLRLDLEWTPRIKSALLQNRFQLFQFPISNLRESSRNMIDVYLRMKDEVGDLVMPNVFIPIAKRNNLMKSLDRWVIGAAIRYCEKNPNSRLFVRLSEDSINDTKLTTWSNKVLKDYNCNPESIVFQITEEDVFNLNPGKIAQTLNAFRTHGYGIAIEHFGCNPAHIELLQDYPIDYIKIDSTLIHGLTENQDRQKVVKALCKIAKKKSVSTIAEHVESADTMAVLYQLGADYMQGTFTLEPDVVITAEAV